MSLLELSGLRAGYGAQDVIRGISLSVAEGEFAALVGPNGHGKTTVLRAISGLLRARGGQILLAGQPLTRLRPDRIVAAGVVHVPQGDLLFPGMSVLDNLRMGACLPAAAAEEKRRLEEVFTLLPKLRDRQGQLASTLSGGERRMVGIGRGLMTGGRILMLDEPSLGLAPIVIDQIYDLVQQLAKSGRTILVVEENAVRIADMADRMYLLDNGEIAWAGTGAGFLSSPEIFATYLGG
ncbi:ABC transporter ATP-binding protein [Pseudogemmobacter humi]|uniref:High-affinity branched-chain amino acid transport ATP-binding protein LivF n=1 Tax=Pseudogemmobacter humi TaxID=2483812 RepID=A0A3P5WWX3_9RHOB|nr:ABC transporter ATP-binding protein [Pseudogemmobacter humi]VDC26375.1 High-affinity branched-chain amino acid transport ATP-binding protein LivF [Pseudogemmobacter humi]